VVVVHLLQQPVDGTHIVNDAGFIDSTRGWYVLLEPNWPTGQLFEQCLQLCAIPLRAGSRTATAEQQQGVIQCAAVIARRPS